MSPLYNVLQECICCGLHVNYIVYNRSSVCNISDLYIPLTVFEIQMDNDDKRKIGEINFCHISHVITVQILGGYTYILTLAIILQCQKWIISESECNI